MSLKMGAIIYPLFLQASYFFGGRYEYSKSNWWKLLQIVALDPRNRVGSAPSYRWSHLRRYLLNPKIHDLVQCHGRGFFLRLLHFVPSFP